MVSPFMQPGNLCLMASSMPSGLSQFPSFPTILGLGSGIDCLLSALHKKVFDSTRATSAGLVLASQLRAKCFSLKVN